MTNTFYFHDLPGRPGDHEAKNFFRSWVKQTIVWLEKYYDKFTIDKKEHGFFYQEQQTKTFLTLALGDVTGGFLLQENPVERKQKQLPGTTPVSSNGRIDYWAAMKPNTYIIEVKQGWIRYYPDKGMFTIYSYIKKNLIPSAEKQVRSLVSKMEYKYTDYLYGLSLVVCPIFYKESRDKDIPAFILKRQTKEKLKNEFRKLGVNVFAVWSLPEDYLVEPFVDGKFYTQHVGLVFLGKFIRVSRVRK